MNSLRLSPISLPYRAANGNEIAIMDERLEFYRPSGGSPCPDQWGNYGDKTYMDAFLDGTMCIVDDSRDGESHGMHGHVYTAEV